MPKDAIIHNTAIIPNSMHDCRMETTQRLIAWPNLQYMSLTLPVKCRQVEVFWHVCIQKSTLHMAVCCSSVQCSKIRLNSEGVSLSHVKIQRACLSHNFSCHLHCLTLFERNQIQPFIWLWTPQVHVRHTVWQTLAQSCLWKCNYIGFQNAITCVWALHAILRLLSSFKHNLPAFPMQSTYMHWETICDNEWSLTTNVRGLL